VLKQSSAFFPAALRYSALSTGPKVQTVAILRRVVFFGLNESQQNPGPLPSSVDAFPSPSETPSSAEASGSDTRSVAVARTV